MSEGLRQPPAAQPLTFEEVVTSDPLQDRIAGALVGAAIADAMGWVTEFMRSPSQLERTYGVHELADFVTWGKTTGGRFNAYIDYVQKGEYSDDTQLTLCTARSMEPGGTCDIDYFGKVEMPHWLSYARGAGATITAAARGISRKSASWNRNFFGVRTGRRVLDYRQAGANGAAMRISPLVIGNLGDFSQARREILRNSIVSHGHPRALFGALLYGRALWDVLNDTVNGMEEFIEDLKGSIRATTIETFEEATEGWVRTWDSGSTRSFSDVANETKLELCQMLDVVARNRELPMREIYENLGCLARETRGSGAGTAAAAIAIFLRYGGKFEKAVTTAVNMIGSDTDTIGAMTAGLVGGRNGYMAIPERWAAQLQDLSYFLRVAQCLQRISMRKSEGPELRFDPAVFGEKNLPNIVDLLRTGTVNQGQRITDPVLGPGWVMTANMQAVRRRGGGKMIFAEVVFDVGQKCKFRAHLPVGGRAK